MTYGARSRAECAQYVEGEGYQGSPPSTGGEDPVSALELKAAISALESRD